MTGTVRRGRQVVGCALAALRLQARAAPVASLATLAITIVLGLLPAVAAWLLKRLLDELAAGHAAGGIAAAAAAMAGLTVAVALFSGFLLVQVRRALTLAVERVLFTHVGRIEELGPFEDPAFHDRLKLAQESAQTAPHEVADFVFLALQTAITVSTLAGVVIALSPLVAVAYLACALTGLVAALARGRAYAAMAATTTEVFRRRDFYRATLTDPRAAKEIRLFGLGDLLLARMLGALDRATRAATAVERRSLLWQVGLALLNAGATAAGAVLVTAGALAGRLQIGDVAMFLAATGAVQHILTQLLAGISTTRAALASFETYLEVLAATPVPPVRPPAQPLQHRILLEDVWFRYAEDRPWVLAGVDLEIPAGTSIGLVGVNGAGKSTLVKIVCGMYAPQRGRVLWDGVDIQTLDPASLRRRLAATFQDFMTYDLTAAENIGLGDVTALDDRARIHAAASQAGIADELAALPRGYDTQLSRVLSAEDFPGGGGTTLSGGQWQRVAIARALMRADADLVILDEPSAGLDPEAEHALSRAIATRFAGRARLLISHRLGSLRIADRIVVLEDGRIVERGTHAELMRTPSRYARLFTLQAESYLDAPAREVA